MFCVSSSGARTPQDAAPRERGLHGLYPGHGHGGRGKNLALRSADFHRGQLAVPMAHGQVLGVGRGFWNVGGQAQDGAGQHGRRGGAGSGGRRGGGPGNWSTVWTSMAGLDPAV